MRKPNPIILAGWRAGKVMAILGLAAALATQAQSPVFLPTITTVAGNRTAGYSGDGGSAQDAELSNTIASTTTDPFGNVYVADIGNYVVRRVDAVTGVITTFAGNGTSGYSGDGGVATAAQMSRPSAVYYYQGSIYIADGTGATAYIRKVDLSTELISTICTAVGPQDVTVDRFGNLYFSQLGGKPYVMKYVLGGGATAASPYAGTGKSGYTGDGGLATSAALNGPNGIVTDAGGNLYIADATNKVIRRVDVNTGVITTYAGGATAVCAGATDTYGDGCPALQAQFGTMTHLTIDPSGALIVVDSSNNVIRKVAAGANSTAGVVTLVAGTGKSPSGTDGAYALDTAIGGPYSVSLTPAGDLLMTERSISSVRVLQNPSILAPTAVGSVSTASTLLTLTQSLSGTFNLPASGEFASAAAPSCSAGSGVNGTVCSFEVTFIPSLAGYASTPLTFTDTTGSVRLGLSGVGIAPVASLLPGTISTVAGTGTIGAQGDNGAATAAQLNTPSAAAFDNQGHLFVTDTANNEVREITPMGTIIRVAGTGAVGSSGDGGAATAATLNAPQGIATDAAGNLYIADTQNNKIRFLDMSTGLISTYVGTGSAGYSGDGANASSATLNGPTGLFLTPSGVLYIADTGNNVIRTIATHSGLISTFAGTGTAGSNGDGGNATVAELSAPSDVVADTSGNVYIADTGNNRLREVNTTDVISTIAGVQTGGFNGDGPAISAELDGLMGISVDTAGHLYIADTLNHRVRAIFGGQITSIGGTGAVGFSGDAGSSNLAGLDAPRAVVLDRDGDIYVVDTGNAKIREISTTANSLTFPVTSPGDTSTAQGLLLLNGGNGPLSVASVTIPNGFTTEAPSNGVDCSTAPLSIAAGGDCTLLVAFQPSIGTSYSGNLAVEDNSQTINSSTQVVSLTGTSAFVFKATLSLPANSVAGTQITAYVTVGNPAQSYTGTLHFTSIDSKATLPNDYTFQAADAGAHAFTIILRTAGVQCVTVTDSVDSSVTATSCANVSPGNPASITGVSGINQAAPLNGAFPSQLGVLVMDGSGNPVPNTSVSFNVNPNGGATATFTNGQTSETKTTDAAGYATSDVLTAGSTVGAFTAAATTGGVSTPATFDLTIAVQGTFTVTPQFTQSSSIQPGATSLQSLTITPSGGFTLPVSFACTAPSGTFCSITPSVATMDGSGSYSQSTLSFTTQGVLAKAERPIAFEYASLLVFMSVGVVRRRRKLVALTVLGFVALAMTLGCGSEYKGPVTANGNYSVTVTATAQNLTVATDIVYVIDKGSK